MRALRTTTRALLVSAGLAAAAIAIASPGGAVPGHTSCKDFGALVANEAQAGTVGAENRSLPHRTVDDLVHAVQVGGTFGDEVVPPFCTPR